MSRWFTNPLKELLGSIFSHFLAPYVENLDMGLVNLGIVQGQVTLRKLRIKKGALDTFRLPVDVAEGHLGKFSLSLHWLNLGNQPVQVLIEDLYILVVPRREDDQDPDELERRMQEMKLERLQKAEALQTQGDGVNDADSKTQNKGFVASFLAKLLNNVQVTIKNVHIRYEDNISVPGHPFAVGVTLSSFSAFRSMRIGYPLSSREGARLFISWQNWTIWQDILILMLRAWLGSLTRPLWIGSRL